MMFQPTLPLSLHEVSEAAQARWKIKIRIRIKVILAGLDAGHPPISEIFRLAEDLPPCKIEVLVKLLQDASHQAVKTNEDHWVSALVD